MTKAQELGRELTRLRDEMSGIYMQYDTGRVDSKGNQIFDFPDGKEEELIRRGQELEEKQIEFENARRTEDFERNRQYLDQLNRAEKRLTVGGQNGESRSIRTEDSYKSLGQRVIDSYEYKGRRSGGNKFATVFDDVDVKTLLTTAGVPGFTPDSPRTNIVVPFPNRPIRIIDMIPASQTNIEIIKWMEQVTFTNNASMTGEGYTKQESALDWDEKTSYVRKIAHWIPVTKEQVDDVPGFMSMVDRDLIYMLRNKLETQILSGTGIGQELVGILQNANLQSQAFSTNNADTVLKAMTLVNWTGYAEVTGIVMNPTNWQTIRLIKGATNQDYVLGSPLIDVAPRLWGVPVVITNAITSGTALVGDFLNFAELRYMNGIEVDVSDSHSTYFVENKLAVRAEMRVALVVKRGSAFCQCTSLT
jgi:HK97 family phage major capsid protein